MDVLGQITMDTLIIEYQKEFVRLEVYWTSTWEEFLQTVLTKPIPPKGQLSFEL